MVDSFAWLTERRLVDRLGPCCPACGQAMFGELDESGDVVVPIWQCPETEDCGHTEPLPVDIQLRWQGATSLPGFGV